MNYGYLLGMKDDKEIQSADIYKNKITWPWIKDKQKD